MSTVAQSPQAGPPAPVPPDNGSLGGSIIACAFTCWAICCAAVFARLYTRGRIKRVIGREDWCVLIAWVGLLHAGTRGSSFVPLCPGNAQQSAYMMSSQLLALGYSVGMIYGMIRPIGTHRWHSAELAERSLQSVNTAWVLISGL